MWCRWVQDYHLMLLPSLLKAVVPKMKVGFFLHTPFPSSGDYGCAARSPLLPENQLC
jgi:trehalose 6-phosphate synthase/phosphatase